MKNATKALILCFFALMTVAMQAQTINTLPTVMPEGANFNDEVTLTCTFPEGCDGGKYWINGAEIKARPYDGPVTLDYSCTFSAAGTNKDGRIITDVVTRDIFIHRVSSASYSTVPKEGVRTENFYVTVLNWQHVTTSELYIDEFKEGGSREGEPFLWLTNDQGRTVASNTFNGIWQNGTNSYKIYFYKDYKQTHIGQYQLHIAKGIFKLDGEVYDQEIVLNYEIAEENPAPAITPESGTYEAPLTVTIAYPTDGSAFYKIYKINGGANKQYTEPIVLDNDATIEAWGIDENFTSQTPTATATYTVTQPTPVPEPLPSPVISYNNGTVTITAEEGATIKYWFNNSMASAEAYAAPFTVSENCLISCVAYTSERKSSTVDYTVSDKPKDRGDNGEQVLLTPMSTESATVTAVSPNGRFATGYIGAETSSRGFVWNLASNSLDLVSAMHVSQLYSISNDGTTYGWRSRDTDVSEDGGEEQLLWGICKQGQWTEVPKGMTVNGITADGRIYGSKDNRPVTYDFATETFTYYALDDMEAGQLTACSDEQMTVFGGYVVIDGIRMPAIWNGVDNMHRYPQLKGSSALITDISANGVWAIVGQTARLNITTGEAEPISTSSWRSSGNQRPEIARVIANDGTIFGTYDDTLLFPDNGVAVVFTTDNRWRFASDWIKDTYNLDILDQYDLRSVRGITADGKTLVFHSLPQGASVDDSFTRGLALSIDVPVKHLAPVEVEAEQVSGMEIVKLTWKAPLHGAEDIERYIIYRNAAELTSIDADAEKVYFDEDVMNKETYTYTIAAIYKDGMRSQESAETIAQVYVEKYLPVRGLAMRQAGLNDAILTWQAPKTTMPKVQYFNEDSEWQAFGTGSQKVDAEWGIRIAARDLSTFTGKQIRTFQFLPSGPQPAYTLNLYKGTKISGRYEKEPFYTQEIDPETLTYGVMNTIELTTPVDIPQNTDIYVGLLIKNQGNDDMLGISFDGFREGYTDLCRIVGVYDKMESISVMSQDATTQVVLPLGLGICGEQEINASIVSNYNVSVDGEPLITTTGYRTRHEDVQEGEHRYSIVAVYRDGRTSDPEELIVSLQNNEKAYVPVKDISITVNDDNTATLAWQAPLNDDRTQIHYGDLEPKKGWTLEPGFDGFMAAATYPATMTSDYAEDYVISEIFFCPTAEADFEVMLQDELGNDYAYFSLSSDDVKLGELNYLILPEPAVVERSSNLWLYVNVTNATEGTAPLAYDSSNEWKNWFSNLFNYGNGMSSLAEIAQVNEHPNWLMGFVVKAQDARPMPLQGYNISVDGVKRNAGLLTDTTFRTNALSEGEHQATVEVQYTQDKTVTSLPYVFNVSGSAGINDITTDGNADSRIYNLAGQRIAKPKGLYLQNHTKKIKK